MMPEPLSSVFRELGYLVLENKNGGAFSLLSDAPAWSWQLFPEVSWSDKQVSIAGISPFLDSFLLDAEAFWNKDETGVLESGTWIERTNSGLDVPLEAKALQLNGKQILAIHSPDSHYAERVKILQTARNSVLDHEKLLSEIQKKEILLHCIVHDLSQPLSAMRGSFDCMAMESDAERMAKFIDLGRHASEQQENMIREILRAFSADLQVTFETESVVNSSPNLLATAKEAAVALTPAYEAKGVRMEFNDKIATNRNWFVHGEATRLSRVFANLLENALRYTPAGGRVTIDIEDDGAFFRAYVDDEGPGLPGDLRPAQIFGLFTKGKESGGKAGLGLYFCRITVERWGGSIGCASLPEKGSRFWFRLPRAVMAEESVLPGKPKILIDDTNQDSEGKRRPMNILLADDQEDIRTLTTHQLQRNGHTVATVGNGKAAVEAAQSKHYDVILLDEEMPVMGGVEAAHAIREMQKKQEGHSVLVALTGNNTNDDRERLIAAGFDSVLGKPFRLESLEAFLRSPGSFDVVAAFPEERPMKQGASLEDLLQRVGGDEKLLRQMIRTFLRETPKRIETLLKALQCKDGPELSARAHALKGSVSIFGAARAAQLTHSLQELGRVPDFQEAARIFATLQEEIAKVEENLKGYAKHSLNGVSPASKKVIKKQKKPKIGKR